MVYRPQGRAPTHRDNPPVGAQPSERLVIPASKVINTLLDAFLKCSSHRPRVSEPEVFTTFRLSARLRGRNDISPAGKRACETPGAGSYSPWRPRRAISPLIFDPGQAGNQGLRALDAAKGTNHAVGELGDNLGIGRQQITLQLHLEDQVNGAVH